MTKLREEDVHQAARIVAARRLFVSASIGFVVGALQETQWDDLPMAEYRRIQVEARQILADLRGSMGGTAE